MQACVTCNEIYTEIVGNLHVRSYRERKLVRIVTLVGVPGIASPIVSLFQKCKRLCHSRIKQKLAAIAPVDVTVSK